jgi:hypothetical protein
MKIKKSRSGKKTLAISLAVLLVIGLSSISVYVFALNGNLFGWQPNPPAQQEDSLDFTDDTPDPEAPPSEEQIRDGENIKRDNLEREQDEETVQNTSLQITASGQSEPSGTVSIRAFIQRITNQGTCTLTLTSGSQTVIRTASLQALPNGSTCQGFDVSFQDLSIGTWNAQVEYSSGTDYGTDSTDIEVRS